MPARIGHIATTWQSSAYAVAAFDTRIELWDTRTLHRNAAFDTCYDYGGPRVAIAPSGDAVLVGSYRRRRVALYDAAQGAERWTCTKLGHVHSVAFDPVNGDILVRAGDAGVMRIDRVNGELVKQYRNALRFEVSPLHQGFGLCEFSRFLSLSARVSGERLWDVRKQSFAVLSVAFTPRLVCVSEVGSCLRGIDVESGDVRWRNDPERGSHYLRLGYSPSANVLLAVLYQYETISRRDLVVIDVATGEIMCRQGLTGETYEVEFAQESTRLLTAGGTIYDLTVPEAFNPIATDLAYLS